MNQSKNSSLQGEEKTVPGGEEQSLQTSSWWPLALIALCTVTTILDRRRSHRPIADVENGKTEIRPITTGYGQEEGVVGRSGILDRIHGLSPEVRYRMGNIGLILIQALLFLAANFLASFSDQWVGLSRSAAMAVFGVYVGLFLVCLCLYFISVYDKGEKSAWRIIHLILVAFVPVFQAVFEVFATSGVVNTLWWKATKLVIGTVCQAAAGYIAWKAAGLIPTPAAKKSSNEGSEK